jgi:hypothetical protein
MKGAYLGSLAVALLAAAACSSSDAPLGMGESDAGASEAGSSGMDASGDAGGGSADAGSCCPVGWLLLNCSYPDGHGGIACHNPALGCASSLTCGAGCDAVVTGPCGDDGGVSDGSVGDASPDATSDASGGGDGSTDAGDCCPATWDLYTCAYLDGGSGMACHNPAQGCASSNICGGGCDRVVTGRCGP